MSTLKEMNDFFSKPRELDINAAEGSVSRYEIEMTNNYFNWKGEVKKRQALTCIFSRKITGVPRSNFFLTEIDIERVIFSDTCKTIRWRFAEGTKIPNYIYCGRSASDLSWFVMELAREGSVPVKQLMGINQVLSRFPKLPSVSLFTLQLLDIIGFEGINGHFLSASPVLTGKPGKAIEIESLSEARADIGLGVYSHQSFFKNGKFFGTYHGVNYSRAGFCSVFGFSCEASQLKTADHQRSKRGNSYYWGDLYVDMETGLMTRGTMFEYLYTVQDKIGKSVRPVPGKVRRKVTLRALFAGK